MHYIYVQYNKTSDWKVLKVYINTVLMAIAVKRKALISRKIYDSNYCKNILKLNFYLFTFQAILLLRKYIVLLFWRKLHNIFKACSIQFFNIVSISNWCIVTAHYYEYVRCSVGWWYTYLSMCLNETREKHKEKRSKTFYCNIKLQFLVINSYLAVSQCIYIIIIIFYAYACEFGYCTQSVYEYSCLLMCMCASKEKWKVKK